jgi:hypothetical protein
MKTWIGKILVTGLSLAMLSYSATRSVDFIGLTLPADRQILAWFGLAALDGGIIVWLLAFLYGSHGSAQRGISIIMVLVDFIGAVTMFTADTIFNTGKLGLTVSFNQSTMLTFVIALSVVIALNMGAGIVHAITDPEHMRKMADEEANGKIEDMARARVSQQSDQLASELAPIIANSWMATTRARYMHAIAENIGKGSIPNVGFDQPKPGSLFNESKQRRPQMMLNMMRPKLNGQTRRQPVTFNAQTTLTPFEIENQKKLQEERES